MIRPVAVFLTLLAAIALSAGPADAAITKIHLSLTASVTRHVTVTQTDETCPDSTSPMTGEMTETASLTTHRTATVVVIPGSYRSLAIETENDMNNSGDILVHGTLTRTSTLGAQGEAVCAGQDPASCGTKPVNLDLRGGPDNGHNGRSFRGIAINGGLQDFRDPFDQCMSPRQMLPSAIYQTVPFPRSFMVSCKHGKLTHRITNTKTFSEPGTEQISGDTSLKLSITVSRLGPLRGYRC
jgi:hypothetical protein